MLARTAGGTSVGARLALPVVIVATAVLAVSLHRQGHTQGDDFALYLRQARSIFEGNPAEVIADNRFAVVNSDSGFSPTGYPWVWPLVLSPFVRFWGLDYDRLKLIEVAAMCVWVALLHGIVRRRVGRPVALAVAAVFATSFAYLQHTEQLITEIPHLASVTLFVWWFDRVRLRGALLTARIFDLSVLGVLGALSFNVRREGLALILATVAIQSFELLRSNPDADDASATRPTDDRRDDVGAHRARHDGGRRPMERRWRRPSEVVEVTRTHVRSLVTPLASFVTAVVVFQLLLPTALLPDNDNSRSNIDDRFGEYPRILATQLGFGEHPAVGVMILLVAVVGVVIGVRSRPHLDGMLLAIAVLSALTIGTHFRKVERYWFQITPWVVYFVAVALIAAAGAALRHRERLVSLVAAAPLAALVVAHCVVLPGHIADVREFDDAGRVLSGPTEPTVAPVYEAVRELTPPGATVAFFRARTMTLLTDRRSFQTKDIDRVAIGADYLAQRRRDTAWQPDIDEAATAGFVEIWSDPTWILWRIPAAGATPIETQDDAS
ncbi:MAG: hypothetical protein ABJH68_19095 [Ilumatobacter sp.]|uniref:hypothetical protein n=1 Tax=Ilumatobacter sp. TaxID=1967498 RepID=UPI003297C774